MEQKLFEFLLELPLKFSEFGSWLTTDLEYINMPPLALFSVGGITIIIAMLVVRLFVGG